MKTVVTKTLPHMFACVLGLSSALLAIPTASAEIWIFPASGGLSCIGLCGLTHDFTSFPNNQTITGAGFSSAAALAANTPDVQMVGKTSIFADENGLGLINDPAPGESEITGTSLIRIAMSAGLQAPVTFTMESTTAGESWLVQGSNSPNMGFGTLPGSIVAGNDEGIAHMIPFFNFYTFSAISGNVLIGQITAVPGPIVGAGLPGLIAACGGLIALARRRRRQGIA
jgi:hypothetical protein